MQKLSTRVITVLETMYTENTDSEALARSVDRVDRTVEVDGNVMYQERRMYEVTPAEPLDGFIRWALSIKKQRQSRGYVGGNSGYGVYFICKGWFKRFKFQKKFFYLGGK